MNIHEIVGALDTEIARLQHVRTLIANSAVLQRHGRPSPSAKAAPKRRVISAEGRKRIAEAQRKRWAARKIQDSVKGIGIPAKEAPKHRSPAAKPKNDLSSSISKTLVAAAAKSVAVKDTTK